MDKVSELDKEIWNRSKVHWWSLPLALKSEAVAYRFTHDADDLAQTKVRVELINKYHGRPSGIFGCDEHLAGPIPSRGSELCTVVETSYSYIYMYMVAGDNTYADYAERLIFNALPAELTEGLIC
jgi:hypothetical protein